MARSIIGDLVWRVIGDTKGFDSSITQSDKKISGFNKTIGLAEKSAIGLAAGLAVVAKQAFEVGKSFDQGLGNVATLLDGSNNDIETLKDNVKDLAIDTGLSLDDLTDGLYQTVSAFGDTAEATEQLELAARAARAGVSTVTDSINLASAVTKAYGDTSAEAQQKVFDLAFEAVRLGQTTFPELAASIQQVTDGSVRLGVSQEELFGTFASLTGVTGDASRVATQLRSALTALDSPTTTLADLYDRLGVASGKVLIEQEGLQGAFQLIVEDAERTGTSLNDYFGRVEAVTAASALATTQSETFATKLDEISQSSGALDAAFETQNETLNGTGAAFDRLTQSVEVLKTTFFDFYSEELANTFNGLTVIVEAIGNLNDRIQVSNERLGVFGDVLGLANPTKAIREYNSLIFRAIGNWGNTEEEVEGVTEAQVELNDQLQSQNTIQGSINAALEEQAAERQAEADALQTIIDLENQRVQKVVEGRGIAEASYAAEIRAIETRNALGITSEEEYNAARLAAEQKLVDDLIDLGYDGLAERETQLQIGDQLILDSIERQKELAEDNGETQVAISDKVRAANQRLNDEAIAQQEAYRAELEKTQQRMEVLANAGIGTLLSGFSDLGEALVAGELSYKSFAKVALNALAAVLDALGAQLAAQAAVALVSGLLGNPVAGGAIGVALAGSAASYAAAGVVRGVAGSFEQGVESIPYPAGVSPTGDKVMAMVNPGERVVPEDDTEEGTYIFEFVLDSNVFARAVVNNINKGRNLISLKRGTKA